MASKNDQINDWLLLQTGKEFGGTITLWDEYLKGLGYEGTINDMQFQWLGSLGYQGSYADRRREWERDVFGIA